MARILIVDVDDTFIRTLCGEIANLGHEVTVARTLHEGLTATTTTACDVIFLNTLMPDGSGLDALPSMIATTSYPEVIMLTDAADADQAEQAIKMGAWDYVERPVTARSMALSLVRAVQYRARKNLHQPHTTLNQETRAEIVGDSPQMRSCLDRLALSADSDANVLISGETGTGKELFAWAIHNNSRRAGRRFVVVDCAALPETLVESILFGHERGAFTGADKSQSGLVKRADGGTLFLDEVGELPPSVQKTFLRVLQEHKFRQVGGNSMLRSDFRLIAATNRDLTKMVQRHRFRKDLLFRLRAFTIELPALRERLEDIRAIATHHVAKLCTSYQLPQKSFSPDFFDFLARYGWPGNVRELVNALERSVAAARQEPVLFPKHLPVYIRVHLARAAVEQEPALTAKISQPAPPLVPQEGRPLPRLVDLRDATLGELEQNYLRALMARTSTMQQACTISGLSRSRLYALLKKHNLPSCFRLPSQDQSSLTGHNPE